MIIDTKKVKNNTRDDTSKLKLTLKQTTPYKNVML